MELTDKERQGRGMDTLGTALAGLVDERMQQHVPVGRPWIEIYEAKESQRRGHRYRADPSDPRMMLRILRYERAVFPEIDATQRAWLDELIQATNRAAHVASLDAGQADRALDTMRLLAHSLELVDVAQSLTELLTEHGQDETQSGQDRAVAPSAGAVPGAPQQGSRVPDLSVPGFASLSVRVGDVDVVALFHEALYYALVHNGVSPVRQLTVVNRDEAPAENVAIRLSVDPPEVGSASAVGSDLEVDLGPVPHGRVDAPSRSLAWPLSAAPFLEIDEATRARIRMVVTIDGTEYVDETYIRLLPADEWWGGGSPILLASFVRPNAPGIKNLLEDASSLLEARTGSPALQGYQAGAGRVHEIAEAIYDAMTRLQITYVEPPSSFTGAGQRIRSHEEVLGDRLGTCLDLACTYAAALEQAGVRPVLVLTKRHAFCGYLTSDEIQLPESVVSSAGAIVTLTDSDAFEAVETTALCAGDEAVGFDQARSATRGWWTVELDEVRGLVDVGAAHRGWAKPLPTIRLDGGVRVVESVRTVEAAPARRTPRTEPGTTTTREDAPARVARWKRSLLDMTFRNPLLRLKAATTNVHIPTGSLGAFEDEVAQGHAIDLVPHDQVADLHLSQGGRTAGDVDADTLRQELVHGHRVFVAHTESEYQRRLKNLQRAAVTAREETGTDSLYLALAVLRWTENGKEGTAPIFLVPVRLTGGRGRTPFRLEHDATRDVEPNFCLYEKLRQAFGIEMPELVDPGDDHAGIDIDGALRSIRRRLLEHKALDFHVEETAHLATFQFATLGMWRDLTDNWESIASRPVVNHLVEAAGAPFHDGLPEPDNDDSTEATAYLPIPADGSQIKAVRWAAAGKSFILEGPPGTGKSQTITNLIAHLMAEGKKVLFVAEKQAALEVVKRRLDSVGLDQFTLDVHGANQTAMAVRRQLKEAIEAEAPRDPSWSTVRARYQRAVDSLSQYPRKLHETGPAGLSAWEARQVLLEIEEAPARVDVLVDVPPGVPMGAVATERVYELAGELGRSLEALGVAPAESPWRLAGPRESGQPIDRARTKHAVDALGWVGRQLEPAMRTLAAGVDDLQVLRTFAAWLDSLVRGIGEDPATAASIVTGNWRAQVAGLQQRMAALVHAHGARMAGLHPAVLELDLERMAAHLAAIDKKLVGKKKARQPVIDALRPYVPGVHELDPRNLTQAVSGLAQVRRDVFDLRHVAHNVAGLRVPVDLNPFRAGDRESIDGRVEGLEKAAAVGHYLSSAAVSSAVHQVGSEGTRGGRPLADLANARAQLLDVLRSTPHDLAAWQAGGTWGMAESRDHHAWNADAQGETFIQLDRWLDVRDRLEEFAGLGFGDLVTKVRAGEIRGTDVDTVVRTSVARALLDERLRSTGLSAFDGQRHLQVVEDFIATGSDVRERMVRQLPGELVAARAFDSRRPRGDVAELQQQISRRRGGMTIRQLMHRFARVIMDVTPCFLMSPTSVARFLPADAAEFDVVVFDEASQIRVPDAIGAMGRAKAVVVVGDSQQMPPTAMFAAGGGDSEEPDESDLPVPVDMESILTEAVEANLPRLLLTWHYRSRDESLIAFSNQNYYEGRLASFPTPPVVERSAPAVRLARVDGVWEGSRRKGSDSLEEVSGRKAPARVNRAEARAIVEAILEELGTGRGRTIGVITFNTQQRDLIRDELERLAERGEIPGELLNTSNPDYLFVKNLENVQGDERDVILFSLAFAKGENGKVPVNWGPLTRTGGEKRLNVAVTRAKEQIVLFASFDPHELDLSSSNSVGLAHLKDYLLLARDGVDRLVQRRAAERDRHLDEVRRALENAGLEVCDNVGLSDFTIDLAVRSADGGEWVAVLLDGPRWAGRESVGDRDGLPDAVLTGQMGWAKTVRIWLPEWLRDPDAVVAHVRREAEAAERPQRPARPSVDTSESLTAAGMMPGASVAAEPVAMKVAADAATSPAFSDRTPQAPGPELIKPELSLLDGQEPFVAADDSSVRDRTILDEQGRRAAAVVREELEAVLAAEGPILIRRLASITARRFGMTRLRGNREEEILRKLPKDRVATSENGDRVAWPDGVDRHRYTAFRVPGDARSADEVPYEELRNALVTVVRSAYQIEEAELLKETAVLFGWSRLGANVRARMQSALEGAVKEGKVQVRGSAVGVVEEGELRSVPPVP